MPGEKNKNLHVFMEMYKGTENRPFPPSHSNKCSRQGVLNTKERCYQHIHLHRNTNTIISLKKKTNDSRHTPYWTLSILLYTVNTYLNWVW